MKKPPLLLVGYGRFGAFAAPILRRRFSVHVLERRRDVRMGRGLKRATFQELGKFGIVILALPAHRLEPFLRMYGKRFRPGAFIADVCAVKDAPLKWMKFHLPANVSFAGLHPLLGPDSTNNAIKGKTVVVCRGRGSHSCHRRLLTFLSELGVKTIETDPITHDKIMISSLFLTQFIGIVVASLGSLKPLPFETPTYRFLKAVARRAGNNSPELLTEFYRYNPDCLRLIDKIRKRANREYVRLKTLNVRR